MNLSYDILLNTRFLPAMPYGLFFSGCILAQGAGLHYAFRIYRLCQEMQMAADGDVEMNLGGDYVHADDTQSARDLTLPMARAAPNGQVPAPAARTPGFTAFSGTGYTLS